MFRASPGAQLNNEGGVLHSNKQYVEALAKYQQATAADPNLVSAWFNQGLVLKQLRRFEEANSALNKALALDPTHDRALKNKYICAQECTKPIVDKIQASIALNQATAAKVIFACVDLKVTKENTVKILEFGVGMESAYEGLEVTTQQTAEDILRAQFATLTFLPPFVMGHAPGAIPIISTKTSLDLPKPSAAFQPELAQSYQAVYAGQGCDLLQTERVLLVGDPTVKMILDDKILTYDSFVATQNGALCPQMIKFPRIYHTDLAKQITAQINSKKLVIKAPDIERGEGVIIVEAEDLDAVLKRLLAPIRDQSEFLTATKLYDAHLTEKVKQECQRKYGEKWQRHLKSGPVQAQIQKTLLEDTARFVKWRATHNAHFLVQEYIEGKPVEYQGQQYDATMRVLFLWIRDQHKVQCVPIASYWKLPPKPISYTGDFRSKSVSSYTQGRCDAVKIGIDDEQLVYRVLIDSIPSLFAYMMQRNLSHEIQALPTTTLVESNYKLESWLRLANILARNGKYDLSEYCIACAHALALPGSYNTEEQRGVCLQLKGEHDQAIQIYSAILLKAEASSTYYKRGTCHLAKGDLKKAKDDFAATLQISPAYAEKIEQVLQIVKEKLALAIETTSAAIAAAAANSKGNTRNI